MSYRSRTLLAILALALVSVSSNRAQAEDANYYSSDAQFTQTSLRDINQQFDEMNAELVSLRGQLQNVSYGDAAASCGCESCGCDDCNGCRGRSLYFAYELTVLNTYLSDQALVPYSNAAATFNDDQYEAGHRFIVGTENCGGVGARFRYWFFDHNHDTNVAGSTFGIDMDVIDLEATLYSELCNWDLLVSGGIRYAKMAYSIRGDGGAGTGTGYDQDTNFEGYGPTVSLEGSREIGCRGLSLVGNFRGSFLLGDINREGFGQGRAYADADDEITTVFETQLGAAWSTEMRNCSMTCDQWEVPCGKRSSGSTIRSMTRQAPEPIRG